MLATHKRSWSWPHFWRGVEEGFLAVALALVFLAVVAWWTVLPSIGLLWLAGLL